MNLLNFGEDIFWKIMTQNTYQKAGGLTIKLKDNLENKACSRKLIKILAKPKSKTPKISSNLKISIQKIAMYKL